MNNTKVDVVKGHRKDMQRVKAVIQQKELTIKNNDLTIQQKEKELIKLRSIYDDLVRKLS